MACRPFRAARVFFDPASGECYGPFDWMEARRRRMADITLTCGTCGKQITVSEYVDAEFMTCLKCHTKVPIPRKQPEPTAAPRLKLAPGMPGAPEPPPAPPATEPTLYEQVRQNTPFMKRRRKRGGRSVGWGSMVGAFAAFFALAGGLLYLRFAHGALPPAWLNLLIDVALLGLVGLHVGVILSAFADDAFQGILTVLIPGYTIYYVFVHSDRYLLRAVVAALLLAFGLDAARVIQHYAHDFYVSVSSWMQNAGEAKRISVQPH